VTSFYVDRMVSDSPATQVQSRQKSTATDEVPKKKDGRGRPRKDRTLELAKSTGTPVNSALVGCTVVIIISLSLVSSIVYIEKKLSVFCWEIAGCTVLCGIAVHHADNGYSGHRNFGRILVHHTFWMCFPRCTSSLWFKRWGVWGDRVSVGGWRL